MKGVLALLLAAGCASGGSAAPHDGPLGDLPDARVYLDAPHADARPDAAPDARVIPDAAIDAMPIPDAAPDAPIIADAAVDAAPDAPIDACVPVTTELLVNPVFDLAPMGTGWTEVPIDPAYPIITNIGMWAAQSTPYKAWLGGITGDDEGVASVTDSLYQDITVPANTTQLVVTGYYTVGTNETSTTTVYDTGSFDLIQTNGTPIENVLSLSNLTPTGDVWQPFSHTFTANVAGQTVRLRMTSTNDQINGTNFFFDTLSLKATYCP